MRVLLVGNYVNNRQQSMTRFAEMMRRELEEAGHEVRLVRPPVILGRLRPDEGGLGKWLGYVDRFVFYPPLLRRQARWADVVHVCDPPNVVLEPLLRDRPHVITWHDMLSIRAALGEIPQSPVGWTGRIYQRWMLWGLRQAQRVVCDSEQTADEVRSHVGVPGGRLSVVPLALNYPYCPMEPAEAATWLSALGLDPERPYFLHVGGNQWYKNRPGVLRLYAEMVKHPRYAGHDLVMAGKPWTPEMRQMVDDLGLRGRVAERVSVSNEQLRALYSRAEALLFPSLQEGFGWPIVEAQACGCAVAVTGRAPMTEVGGQAALYIDPADPVGAASVIAEALTERERWRNLGLENVSRFSTEAMVDGYLRSYRAVTGERPLSGKGSE